MALLAGSTARLYVDNMGTAFWIGGKVQGTSKKGKLISFLEKFHGGSRCEENQDAVEQIVGLAVEHNCGIDACWIPRDFNTRADASTHITTIHDFKLCPKAFAQIEEN